MAGHKKGVGRASLSFSAKIVCLMLLTVLVVGGATLLAASRFFTAGFNEQAETAISRTAAAVQKELDDSLDRLKKNAVSFATRPDLAEAVDKKDTKRLQEIARALLKNNGLEVLTIADDKGTVLARGHSEKFGDSVANQINVKKALAGEASVGLEEGSVVKFSMRSGAPIKVDGRIVGTITPGLDLTSTTAFVDSIKQQFNVECTIFKNDERVTTTLEKDGKRLIGTKMDNPQVIDIVLRKGQKFLHENTIAGHAYNTAYWPLIGADGKIAGMVFIGSDKSILEKTSMTVISAVIIAGLVIGLFMITVGYFLVRSMIKPMLKAMSDLNADVDEVSTAAGVLSSSSQKIAEGASEQAASIEETSSSLEEMSSMTRQNANNADQANSIIGVTKDTVARAGQSMEKLITSMGEISRASEETSKIIKTIDEIAFQTNLLALNAAVEAARAGEAGAGFAVVADEVRNLAMRAAEAAKNTAGLIEGTVKRVKEGSSLVEQTAKEFMEVSSSVGKSSELVHEISAASQEQAQGIEQVNRAVNEMDKVVQQNAAETEELASASEKMNSQAVKMKRLVGLLTSMVRGAREEEAAVAAQPPKGAAWTRKVEGKSTRMSLPEKKNAGANGNGHWATKGSSNKMLPEKPAPFDTDL